ncbi:UDP-N-acetylglucosamine 2-epimerase [Lysinibacillus sp. NPDC096418]|uniref:UDP-N-acetylglucosamine 2-epimerase n=1 Tax=Lysinibacillus sp. NPDC096418 TaxID=3364138 RepID=UPI00382E45A6
MKKAFLVSYGGGHINIILSVAKELSKYLDVTILGLTNAKLKAINAGFKTKTYYDYASEDEIKLGMEYKYLHVDGNSFDLQDTIAYYGVNLQSLIEEVGETKALNLFKELDRKVFLPVEKFKEIFQLEKPDIILVTNSPRSEFAALLAAKEMNIPSISIEDLFGMDPSEFGSFRKINRFKIPDYICVMSEIVKSNLIEMGVEKDKIVVTGQPAFDDIHLIDSSPNLIEKEILYASQPTSNTHSILAALIKVKKEGKIKEITVKLHPSQQVEEYSYIKDDGLKLIEGKVDIKQLITKHRVVLTEYSTVGLEAVFLDRALVTVSLSSESELVPYEKLGLSYNANDLNELKTAIIKAIDNGPTDSALKWKSFDNASFEVCKLVKKVTGYME